MKNQRNVKKIQNNQFETIDMIFSNHHTFY